MCERASKTVSEKECIQCVGELLHWQGQRKQALLASVSVAGASASLKAPPCSPCLPTLVLPVLPAYCQPPEVRQELVSKMASAELSVEFTLRLLGLEGCADTVVGDAMIR